MLIDQIAAALHEKRVEVWRRSPEPPSLVVYVHYDTFQQCMAEISGLVDMYAHDFVMDRGASLMGYPVYKVGADHPPYRIVEC